jgi:signal peptidase II
MEQSSQPVLQKRGRVQYVIYLIGLSAVVLALDLWTKHLIEASLQVGESVQVVGDTVRLTYILNEGGAFGMSIGSNAVYSVVSLLVIAGVIYAMWRRLAHNKVIDFSLAGVVGGAVGNLIDRLRYGAVVDFLDVNIPDIDFLGIQMQRWPIFNVADAAVTVGMILIVAALLFSRSETPAPQI